METRTKKSELFLHTVEKKYITKFFKGTNVKIAYKTSNTVGKIVAYKNMGETDKLNRTGIYQLTCPDCGKKYTGQTGRSFRKRCDEHFQSSKYKNPNHTFPKHLHGTGHSFGPMECIMDALHFVKKGKF